MVFVGPKFKVSAYPLCIDRLMGVSQEKLSYPILVYNSKCKLIIKRKTFSTVCRGAMLVWLSAYYFNVLYKNRDSTVIKLLV